MDAGEWPASRSDFIILREISPSTHLKIQASMWVPEMFSKLSRADYFTKAYIKIFISQENYNTADGNNFSSHSLISARLILRWRGEGRGG